MYLNLCRTDTASKDNPDYPVLHLLLTILILFLSLTSLHGQSLFAKADLAKGSDTIRLKDYLVDVKKLGLINPASDTDFLRISSSKYFLELS